MKRHMLTPLIFCLVILLTGTILADDFMHGEPIGVQVPTQAVTDEVNLFTGDLVANVNLANIRSRNGLSFNLNLLYNSDIWNKNTGRNDTAQVSCFGMGWNLDIPAIIGKSTFTEQDTFHYEKLWYNAGGSSNELVHVADTTYKLKEYKHWVIHKILDSDADWDIARWEITDENGIRYYFGHKCEKIEREWGEYLGNEYCKEQYRKMGYRWNLTKIEDNFGNTISFSYIESGYDIYQNLSDVFWNGSAQQRDCDYDSFATAFYLDKIANNATESVIKFNWESRTDYYDEFNDPWGMLENECGEDGYQELFTKYRLKEFKVYDKDPDTYSDETCIRWVTFGYEYDNYVAGDPDNYDKLQLVSIQEIDPTDSSHKLPDLNFDYYLGTSAYEGALKFIDYPDSSRKSIDYESNTADADVMVDETTVYSGLSDGEYITTEYDYSKTSGNYQVYEDGKFIGYDEVKVYPDYPSRGFIKNIFENPGDGDTYEYRKGILKKIEFYEYNDNNNTIKVITDSIETVSKSDDCYLKRLYRRIDEEFGISDTTLFDYWWSGSIYNVLPSDVTRRNTDGKKQINYNLYACHFYNEMNDANMLTQLVGNRLYFHEENQDSIKSYTITTWKDWDSGAAKKYAPSKTYQWKEDDNSFSVPGFNFSYWSDAGEPTSGDSLEWKRTLKILKRDSYGNVQESMDGNSVVTTTKYGYNSTLPIATIRNARDAETSYVSFEDSTEGDWDYWTSGSISDSSRTGGRGWFFSGSIYGHLTKRIWASNLNTSGKYTASAWVKTDSDQPNILWYIKYNGGSSEVYLTPEYAQGLGTWELVKSTVDLSGYNNISSVRVYIRNGPYLAAAADCMCDDLRFYPADAMMSTQCYDLVSLRPTSTTNENNLTIYKIYDAFGRVIEEKLADYETISAHSFREGNPPNFVQKATFQNGNYSLNWSFEENDLQWQSFWSGSLDVDSTATVKALYGDHYLKITDSDNHSDPDGAHFSFYNGENDSNNHREYAQLIDQPVTFSAWVRTNSGTKRVRIGIENNTSDTLTVGTDWQRISVHINDLDYIQPNPATQPKRLRCFIAIDSSLTGTIYVDGVVLERSEATEPGDIYVSTTYTDGLGRKVQTHVRDGDYDIVTKTTYNSVGKVDTVFHPVRISNSDHQYITDYDSFGNYERYEYYTDPIGRIKKQTHSDSTEIEYEYDAVTLDSRSYRYVKTTDEEGNVSRKTFDKLEQPYKSHAALGETEGILWQNIVDLAHLESTVYPPNKFDPPGSSSATDWQDAKTAKNTVGQVTQQVTLDEGTTRYIYDNNGNLRYSQNSQEADDDHFTVYYYDEHNRVTLVGVEKDQSYNWSTSFPSIDNTDFGTEADEWKVKNYYDSNFVTGADNVCHGKLTKVLVNTDSDTTAEHTTKYVYNRYGHLIEKRITVFEGDDLTEKIIKHEYDLLGREIELTYPSGNSLVYQYDQTGKLAKISSMD